MVVDAAAGASLLGLALMVTFAWLSAVANGGYGLYERLEASKWTAGQIATVKHVECVFAGRFLLKDMHTSRSQIIASVTL